MPASLPPTTSNRIPALPGADDPRG
jgi:hypothetical protein